MARWLIRNKKADIPKMARVLNISEVTAQVLVNRDINTKGAADRYLNPRLEALPDIELMDGVKEGFEIIRESIRAGEKIMVYGDYDVDGVMSTTILVKSLKLLGADVGYYIPDRMSEGYGLNMDAVGILHDRGTDLIILCDNGIASIAEIELARELGMKTIIIDHHEPGYSSDGGERTDLLPPADTVIDPKKQDCTYPFKQMCAAGICYRFMTGLFTYLDVPFPIHDELLIFAAMATFCDIVDLQEDNRVIAKSGLGILNAGPPENIGLKALIEEKSYQGKHIGEFAVGFIFGPCINASGRLEKAEMAVELFLTEDEDQAKIYAHRLAELNEERKAMTLSSFKKIVEPYEAGENKVDKIIVIYDEDIHESIAGIVAGRIKERFCHPAVVLTKGEGEAMAKGSARSIEGYNIYEELYKCRDLFERFGGHAMAAGLTLKEENIALLREKLNSNCLLRDEDFEEIIRIDMALPVEQVTYELAESLQGLRPYGKANKEPLFGTKNLLVSEIRIIEEKDTIIFTFLAGEYRKIKGLCFGMLDRFKKAVEEYFDDYDSEKIFGGMLRNITLKLDVVYYVDINEYNNNVSVQMNIKDFRLSE